MPQGASSSAASSAAWTPSSHAPSPYDHDERDSIDLLGEPNDADDIFGDDPLADDLNEPMSFKRKQKQSAFSQPARFLSSLTGSRPEPSRNGYSSPARSQGGLDGPLEGTQSPRRRGLHPDLNPGSKDGMPLDWYVEGPGRRVGYEDLTAIDWIFEYTKERQRLRVLYSSATGLVGYVRQLLDSSQIWVILVLTGLAVGALAAAIDITTNWLGDLKTGFCQSGPDGGAFYLNRDFCCYGYDEGAKCLGWKPWAAAVGVTSAGGKWFVEYFFFLLFAVSLPYKATANDAASDPQVGYSCSMLSAAGQGVCILCQA